MRSPSCRLAVPGQCQPRAEATFSHRPRKPLFYPQSSYPSAGSASEGKRGKEHTSVSRATQSHVSERKVISPTRPLPRISSLHPPNRRPSEIESSSSEQYESSGRTLGHTHPRYLRSHRRRHPASPPTDSDDDDPFHFDSILSSQPTKKEDDSPSRTLSSSLLRRASIIPVDPTATPAPHRFSLLRERGSEETIFVQEICDADGRRWSLRVPASGLPEDMVHMLEELEKLAVELGQALPRIVVTCSAESLSLKRRERDVAFNSSELLRPPPAVDDESLMGCDLGARRRSLAQEKRRLAESEHVSDEPTRLSEPPSGVVSSASEQSLKCIYIPEVSRPRLPSHSIPIDVPRRRTRVLIRQLNLSHPTAGRRLPQQTNTLAGDRMPAPAPLLLSAQGSTTAERPRQTSSGPCNNHQQQDGIRDRDWGCLGLRAHDPVYEIEIEIAHRHRSGGKGIAGPENQLEIAAAPVG